MRAPPAVGGGGGTGLRSALRSATGASHRC